MILNVLRKWWSGEKCPSPEVEHSSQRVRESSQWVKEAADNAVESGRLARVRQAVSEASRRDEKRIRGE